MDAGDVRRLLLLISLDLSNFHLSNTKISLKFFIANDNSSANDKSSIFDTTKMFSDCSSLKVIYCDSAWDCERFDNMFLSCSSLQGAVAYDESHIDISMANPKTGYFTKKELTQGVEAYVIRSADKKSLTFYCDRERKLRMSYLWDIEETTDRYDEKIPSWLVV